MTREEQLEAEVDRLQHIVDTLTASDQAQKIRAAVGVTPTCAKILACLLAAPSNGRSNEALYAYAMQYDNGDGPEIEGLKVHMTNARNALRKAGAPEGIVCVWGWGYRMSVGLQTWLRARLQPQAVAA